MKKIYTLILVVAAAAFVSCADNAKKAADQAEGTATECCGGSECSEKQGECSEKESCCQEATAAEGTAEAPATEQAAE